MSERLGLWEGYGVEVEMMIVDAGRLDVRPVADRLFEAMGWAPEAGEPEAERGDDASPAEGPLAVPGDGRRDGEEASVAAASDLEVEGIGWSNEVALHVLELKTPGPAEALEGLAARFQESVRAAGEALEGLGCRLLPGGAHPWMYPADEFWIWPHEYTDVYRAYDRIFSCRGHGWANLQSAHLNLPFRGDEEFGRLHEAVRLVLPLMPALAASSPILEGAVGPALDNRLLTYRDNSRRVPSVTGDVVPEPAATEAEYRERILEPIYRDLEAHDPDGLLRHEWVNSRGAIARFGRGSIEIRVLDAQECPRMDLTVLAAVAAAVRRAAEVLDAEPDAAADAAQPTLVELMERTTRHARAGRIDAGTGPLYQRVLDLPGVPRRAGDVWEALLEETLLAEGAPEEWRGPAEVLLEEGTLAERILAALGLGWPRDAGERPGREPLREVYSGLADALAAGEPFRP